MFLIDIEKKTIKRKIDIEREKKKEIIFYLS